MYNLRVQNQRGEKLQISGNPAYTIKDVSGLNPPEAVINTTRTATDDGSVYNSSYVNDRLITLTLAVNYPAEENRINLYRYFKTKYPVRVFYQTENRNVYIDGYVQNFDVSYFDIKQTVQISILCPKPLLNDVSDNMTEFSSITGMFEFPFSIEESGVEFSTLKLGETKTIINDGDVYTGITIKLKANGRLLNPKIYNVETGESLILNVDMFAGDEISINTRRKEKTAVLIKDGEETNIVGKIRQGSTWFQLAPGDNLFLYDCDEFPENLQCTFIMTNQYEGV